MDVGDPQVGEVTRFGGVTRLSISSLILIWSRLHDGWVDPQHVISPIWGPPLPSKQILKKHIDREFGWMLTVSPGDTLRLRYNSEEDNELIRAA